MLLRNHPQRVYRAVLGEEEEELVGAVKEGEGMVSTLMENQDMG